jgi:hypothetical protein
MPEFISRRARTVALGAALTTLMLAAACRAQITPPVPGVRAEPLVTDRPDFTESALTIPPGLLQAELGFTTVRTQGDREDAFGEVLLRIGMGRKTEVRLGLPSYLSTRVTDGNTSGLSDASLGMKWNLARAGDGYGLRQFDLGVIVQTTLPTGDRNYRENTLQPGVKFLAASALTEKIAVSSNLNYDYLSEGGERFGQFASSLSFGFGLTDKVGVYTEYFGFYPTGKSRSDSHFLNAGTTYLVNNDLQLDARIGKGFNGIGNDYFIGLGASRRF